MTSMGEDPMGGQRTADDRPVLVRHGVEVVHDDLQVVHHDGGPPAPPRRSLAVVLGSALVVVLAATLALMWATDGGEVQVREQQGAAAPAAPEPLAVEVTPPAEVVAGTSAAFTLAWNDGSGIFSGTTEEWGDDVGASSVKEGRCEAGAAAPDPTSGSVVVSHTWAAPGTYDVVLGVTTYTCTDGTAVREEASRSVTVEVLPAP